MNFRVIFPFILKIILSADVFALRLCLLFGHAYSVARKKRS
jgi:hypothetical protein